VLVPSGGATVRVTSVAENLVETREPQNPIPMGPVMHHHSTADATVSTNRHRLTLR
jgi:hypothetical protein